MPFFPTSCNSLSPARSHLWKIPPSAFCSRPLQRFRGKSRLVPLPPFEPKLGILNISIVEVFRKTEGDCSGSYNEKQGGYTFPLWTYVGRREQKISPTLRGCSVFQEGPGIERDGKVENEGNFANDISLDVGQCSERV